MENDDIKKTLRELKEFYDAEREKIGSIDELVGGPVDREIAIDFWKLSNTETEREMWNRLALLDEVARGAYLLEPMTAADTDAARAIIERHHDQAVGLADASIMVLAQRHDVWDVLTLDERHFRSIRGERGQRFRLLPADRS